MVVTSYGRNKNRGDKIKKTKRRPIIAPAIAVQLLKIEITVKIKVKLPHVNKKQLARKRIFVQIPFSHSTLKLERKNFTPQNQSLFRSISCFGVIKITIQI